MASGVSSPESGRVPGIALEFPARETISSTSPKIPLRLQRRLEECKTPSTIEEIEAKLRDADVRRQVSLLYLFPSLKNCIFSHFNIIPEEFGPFVGEKARKNFRKLASESMFTRLSSYHSVLLFSLFLSFL